MKKIIALLLCISTLMLFGCGKSGDNTSSDAPLNIESKTYTESENGNNISIAYYTVSGDKYAAANQAIEDAVTGFASRYYLEGYADLHLDIDCSYNLTESENVLSLVFSGTGIVNGAAYPNNHFFTVNIDLRSGSKFKLFDRYALDENFLNAYKAAPYILEDESMAEYIDPFLASFSDGELLSYLAQADDDQSWVSTYYTDSALGVCFPTVHAIGDYVLKEIPYDAISGIKR